MKLTAELSLYPFNEDYIPVIQAFIDEANATAGLQVVTNAMSTQICGEWAAVFTAVSDLLRRSHDRHGCQVLVCKFIPGELGITG